MVNGEMIKEKEEVFCGLKNLGVTIGVDGSRYEGEYRNDIESGQGKLIK